VVIDTFDGKLSFIWVFYEVPTVTIHNMKSNI